MSTIVQIMLQFKHVMYKYLQKYYCKIIIQVKKTFFFSAKTKIKDSRQSEEAHWRLPGEEM